MNRPCGKPMTVNILSSWSWWYGLLVLMSSCRHRKIGSDVSNSANIHPIAQISAPALHITSNAFRDGFRASIPKAKQGQWSSRPLEATDLHRHSQHHSLCIMVSIAIDFSTTQQFLLYNIMHIVPSSTRCNGNVMVKMLDLTYHWQDIGSTPSQVAIWWLILG